MQRSSTVHSSTVLWQQKRFLTVILMMNKQHQRYKYIFDHFYSSISQVQVRTWSFKDHHHKQRDKNRHGKYIYLKYTSICSVNKTVPKYFRMRVCSSEGIPYSNGFFFFAQLLAKFCPIQTRRSCWMVKAGQRAARPGKADKGLWEWRMCGNVDGSDDWSRAVVGDGWT